MSLQWPDERYVRVYIRDTVNWKSGPWQARAVLPLIMRKLERDGALDLDGEGVPGLAVAIDMPLEVVEPGVAYWLRKGTLVIDGNTLAMPNFVEAQEAVASNAKRCRDYRDRTARQVGETAVSAGSTRNVSEETRNVSSATRGDTPEHAATRGDTPNCAVPSLAVPNRERERASAPSPADGDGVLVPVEQLEFDDASRAIVVEVGVRDGEGAFALFVAHFRTKAPLEHTRARWIAEWRKWLVRERKIQRTEGARTSFGKPTTLQRAPPSGPLWKPGQGSEDIDDSKAAEG